MAWRYNCLYLRVWVITILYHTLLYFTDTVLQGQIISRFPPTTIGVPSVSCSLELTPVIPLAALRLLEGAVVLSRLILTYEKDWLQSEYKYIWYNMKDHPLSSKSCIWILNLELRRIEVLHNRKKKKKASVLVGPINSTCFFVTVMQYQLPRTNRLNLTFCQCRGNAGWIIMLWSDWEFSLHPTNVEHTMSKVPAMVAQCTLKWTGAKL